MILQEHKEIDYEREQILIELTFGTNLNKGNWSLAPMFIPGKSVLFVDDGNTNKERSDILEAWGKKILSPTEVVVVPSLQGDCLNNIIQHLKLDMSKLKTAGASSAIEDYFTCKSLTYFNNLIRKFTLFI